MFVKLFHVTPNTRGYLYRNHLFQKELEPGVYRFFAPLADLRVYTVPLSEKQLNVLGNEILAKDLIAFRISYSIRYAVKDGRLLLSSFDLRDDVPMVLARAEERMQADVQRLVRNAVSQVPSEELLEKRDTISEEVTRGVLALSAAYGIEVRAFVLRDTNFPKNIQDLFAKRLEARVRSQADLENARTQVAAARTLKNAAQLMKGDENLRFIQVLELLEKAAAKGKHTFVIGDLQGLGARGVGQSGP